jgi:hypothetical protein
MKLSLYLSIILLGLTLCSCKQGVVYVTVEDEIRNDTLFKKYISTTMALTHLVKSSVKTKEFQDAKQYGESKEYLDVIKSTKLGELTYKQSHRNVFYYTSLLYAKYIKSNKISKESFLNLCKEEIALSSRFSNI